MPEIETPLNNLPAYRIEKEVLGLPSDFTEKEGSELPHVTAFVDQEAPLREGCQIVVKAYESMRDRKAKNDSGYKNTIAQNQLNDVEHRRDIHIANYMARRAAMM
ncbi:hypothetical protein C8R44DRAFT_744714 [Mycena epipterygia]|nr:hypothetical protein C8R44DRAFT_744714 [Mycena epipterygia]